MIQEQLVFRAGGVDHVHEVTGDDDPVLLLLMVGIDPRIDANWRDMPPLTNGHSNGNGSCPTRCRRRGRELEQATYDMRVAMRPRQSA